jgi:hypothetical protein
MVVHHSSWSANLVDTEELNVKDKSGVGGDEAGETSLAVAVVTGDGEHGSLAERELGDTLVPSSDDIADTNGGLEGLASISRRVKLLAVLQSAHVVDGDGISLLGVGLAVAGLELLNCDTHVCDRGVEGACVGE